VKTIRWHYINVDRKKTAAAKISTSKAKLSSEVDNNTKMGVEKQVIRPGTGPKPTAGQNVTVHCTGFG
jgi:peptidylprolyl isomerase